MDIKDIIASGVVESYVLGLASEKESKAVECLSKIYPEIQDEILRCAETVEMFAQRGAVNPPMHLKSSILSKIQGVEQEQPENKVSMRPDNVVQMNPVAQPNNFWKYTSVAASLAFLLVSGVYLMLRTDYARVETALTDSKENVDLYQSEITALNSLLADKQIIESFVQDADLQSLVLGGTDYKPEAHATILYKKNDDEVLLHAAGLPVASEGKQFQLWAIVDGTPVSLGVVERDSFIYKTALPANIDRTKIQAFAITLEDEGGKPTPNLEELHVIGFL